MSQAPKFIVYDSQGLHLWSTGSSSVKLLKSLETDSKLLNVIPSNDCRFLAILYKESVKIFSQEHLERSLYEFPIENIKHVSFSPKSTMLLAYASTTLNQSNLKVFDLSKNGYLVHEWSDNKGELVQWSSDESIAHRMVGSDILFYENNDFTKCAHKFSQQKLTTYEFVTNKAGCSFVAIFIKGQKGSPSTIRVHGYPYLGNAVVSKNFYKADSVDIKWNTKGDAILAMVSTDYDSSGKSYYGETMLHFLDLRGETYTITGNKEGTVSAAEWLPNNDGFIVIQGKVPSSITWYNNRAEPNFSFGDAAVNGISINPFSSLVAFTGFGNLPGNVYIWNLRTKTLISNFKAMDTTCFSWLADGQHLITATHYDRLKVANGFKLWDYLGTMLHQQDCHDDSQIQLFKLFPFDIKDGFLEPQIGAGVKGKVLCEEPVRKYVPPSLRNKTGAIGSKLTKPPPLPNLKQQQQVKDPQIIKEKKLKNLKKKLQQIEHLKKLQSEGKKLEKNQLNKIEKEHEILKAIESLKLEA